MKTYSVQVRNPKAKGGISTVQVKAPDRKKAEAAAVAEIKRRNNGR